MNKDLVTNNDVGVNEELLNDCDLNKVKEEIKYIIDGTNDEVLLEMLINLLKDS